MTTNYQGIDYGMGQTNIDKQTGIRFGVINQGEVGEAWYDESESDYGKPTCPKCGNEAIALPIEDGEPREVRNENGRLISADTIDAWEYAGHECADYACEHCKYVFGSESAFGDEPLAFFIDNGEYKIFQSGDDTDLFIEKSPYFTYAQFCSPCAPGAVYLMNPLDEPSENNRGYCLGHDWFENGKAPYPVYSVATGNLV